MSIQRTFSVLGLAVVSGMLLTACDQAKELSQNAASAVAGHVVNEVKNQANQVIDQVASEADQALAPLGIQSSAVASQVKEQAGELARQVLKAGNDWQQLENFTGQTPADIGLLSAVSPIQAELKQVLGADFEPWRDAMAGAGVMKKERVLYVTAPSKQGKAAWLLIDTQSRKLVAGYSLNGGKDVKEFASKGEPLYRPGEVAELSGKR